MNDPVEADTAPDQRPVAQLIRGRRTIHDFVADREVPAETLQRALELARWAPNHRATEPWHFYLLGRETAGAIARLNADMVTAKRGPEAGAEKLARWQAIPGWLLLTCDRSEDLELEREDYAACCCAAQNLQLYLWSEGVGVKWTTGAVTRDPRFFDLVWVDPTVESVVGLFWYGYACEVPRPGRKPVSEFVVSLP